MKDGIGEGFTRADHQDCANQLFASYARVQDARALASVIGEEELSDVDKRFMVFGKMFEKHFVNQGPSENRPIEDNARPWGLLLRWLPRVELAAWADKVLEQYYRRRRLPKNSMFNAHLLKEGYGWQTI
jgi:V/A-type H+-transporting ATPase subunit B